MRLIGFCLLIVGFNSFAKSLTLSDWVSYFENQNVQIIYSSDFLQKKVLNTILEINSSNDSADSNESIVAFNQALKSLALTLIEVDQYTYVINPIKKTLKAFTGLIIKLVDSENNPIQFFSINNLSTSNGLVLLDNIDPKDIQLSINSPGYFSLEQSETPVKGKYKLIVIELKLKPVSIDKIIVTASQVNFHSPNASKKSLLREDIENTVSLGNDPVRAIQTIPGNTSSGISGKTRTRGGDENESLIVLDNHILRNPFHFQNFFSLFSTINLSTVDGLDFYSGVFPIQYGGRLSSVLDIQTGENYNQTTHEIGFDLINTYYNYRYHNDDYSKQSLASFRTGGKLINEHFVKDSIIQPEFDDAYFKASQELNDFWKLSQHLLISRDEIAINDRDEDENGQNFGETASAGHHDQDLWLRFNYDNLHNIQAELQIYSTRKHNTRSGNISNTNSIASLSEDILTKTYGVKYNQSIVLRDNLSLSFGADISNEDTVINSTRNINHFGELASQLDLQRQTLQDISYKNDGLGINTYINTRYQFNDKLIFDMGLRFEKKQWIDKNVTSPRFNMSYFYNDSTIFRFALGRHQQSQYIDELLLEDETPTYFDPTSADLTIFELNKIFSPTLNLRAEIYYKKYSSTQPFYENLFNGLQVLPDLFYDRIRVTPQDAKAVGLEITLNGIYQHINWSASYIFSDADDEIDGRTVPRSWDQHNSLKLGLHTKLNTRYFRDWNLDITTNYHTGWAKTDTFDNDGELEISPRNSSTFNDFLQFDIKFSKTIATNNGQFNFAIQANNLFNADNPCCVDYEIEEGILQSEEKKWQPLTPNLIFTYQWD